MKRVKCLLLVMVGVVCLGTLVPAGWAADQADWPQYLKDLKKPNQFTEWGFDLRFRNEEFPNAIDRNPYNNDPLGEWYRIRSRFYLNLKPYEDLTIRTRIVNESRPIVAPDPYVSGNPYDRYDRFDETIFDQLYIELKCHCPFESVLRVGRQDWLAIPGQTGPMGLGFGSGLIFMDGTPGDGSRSAYFDAIRYTMDMSQWTPDSSLDFMAISNKSYSNDHIPNFGNYDDHRRLDLWDTETYAVYYKNGSILPEGQVDAYYIYKINKQLTAEPWERATRPGSHTSTAGLRFSSKLWEGGSYEMEGATQWGAQNGNDLRAFASQTGFTQKFKDTCWTPTFKAYHAYLSGDNPDTNRVESWNPVYGNWPKWGELIGYMGATEDGVYYFTNMHILRLEGTIEPLKNWSVNGVLQWVFADENTHRARAGFSNTGLYRGFNPQVCVTYKPTKFLQTHFRYEWFKPGNYMASPAADTDYHFLRTEVTLNF